MTSNCTRCRNTGYSDHAGFAMDPCNHDNSAGGAKTVKVELDLPDAKILEAMKCRTHGVMTYVICNILSLDHGYRGLKTSAVLTRLKRMERAGIVERVRSPYAVQLCWRAC